MNKRVIVLAPHPDDEVIGCGGTLLNHKRNGDRIFIVYLTTGEVFLRDKEQYEKKVVVRKSEAKSVCDKGNFEFLYWSNIQARSIRDNYINLQKDIIKIFQYVRPNYIYIPNEEEKDTDHSITNSLSKESYWLSQAVNENNIINSVNSLVYSYEVWSPLNKIHKYVDISSYIDKKLELIKLYASQIEGINYAEGIKGLNQYRSVFACGSGFAEAYKLESF